MPLRIFTIAFNPDQEVFADEELNRFLTGKKVHSLKAEFFTVGGKAYWSVFVDYQPVLGKESEGGGAGLSDAERTLLLKLKEWRKETADREKLPVFIVATNRQLAEVARRSPFTLEALRQISGFGPKKLQQHGRAIVEIVSAFFERKPPEPPQRPNQEAKPLDAVTGDD